MRTYHDPEDDYYGKAADYERLMDRADYLRTERKDREMEEAQEMNASAMAPASLDADFKKDAVAGCPSASCYRSSELP